MLLVVFGAGASYDSVHKLRPPVPPEPALRRALETREDHRPPLASQLFDTRQAFEKQMAHFPTCHALISQLRHERRGVEEQLSEFDQRSRTYPLYRQSLAAIRYYLHCAIEECQKNWQDEVHFGHTNFIQLIQEINRWRFETDEEVAFVTFNYDTMVEDALCRLLRFEIKSLDSYVSWPGYYLIKLHGSVNWALEVAPDKRLVATEDFIRLVDELEFTDAYRILKPFEISSSTGTSYSGNQPVFPALAIPLRNKDDFSCPVKHVDTLEGLLPRVTKILTIGWRGAETTFSTLLKEHLRNPAPDLLVVSAGQKDANETRDNLSLWGSSRADSEVMYNVNLFGHGFSALVDELSILEHFLREPIPSSFARR
jgi:hypothetical protein